MYVSEIGLVSHVQIFCILTDVLSASSVSKRGVLKSLVITTDLFVPSFYPQLCFISFKAKLFDPLMFRTFIFLLD